MSINGSDARRENKELANAWKLLAGLVLLAVVSCAGFEWARRTWPRDGGLTRERVLAVAETGRQFLILLVWGLLLHRFWHFHWNAGWWRYTVLGLGAAALGNECAALAGVRTIPVAPWLWDYGVLNAYLFFGWYQDVPLFLFAALTVGITAFHGWRISWVRRGRGADVVDAALRDSLEHHPDGCLFLVLHAIHWRIFGCSTDDESYLAALRGHIDADRATITERQRQRLHVWLGPADVPRRPRAADLAPEVLRLANLARYLTIPMTATERLPRLVEAAECYCSLQLAGLPETRSGAYLVYADCREEAGRLEQEIYRHVLNGEECAAAAPTDDCGPIWNVTMRAYALACHVWLVLPVSVRRLLDLAPKAAAPPAPAILTDGQRALVTFLMNPTVDARLLVAALKAAEPTNPTSRKLAWLAVAKWLDEAGRAGTYAHERIIDGHTRLRREHAATWLWHTTTAFENVASPASWLESWCACQIGAAWLRYRRLLRSLDVGEEITDFALRQATSNLQPVSAMSLTTGQ